MFYEVFNILPIKIITREFNYQVHIYHILL